jgi:hypothetical protein
MDIKRKELREALKLAIKGLIVQEVRVIQLHQSYPPRFILDEMAHSIEEAKRQVMALVRLMPPKEREALIKRLIHQSVDEEIDQSIRVRKKRCLRCIHVRYFDEAGLPHATLPVGEERAQVIGCEVISSPSGIECRNFDETPLAASIDDYLDEMSVLYEVKDMFDHIERIWEDYLTK